MAFLLSQNVQPIKHLILKNLNKSHLILMACENWKNLTTIEFRK